MVTKKCDYCGKEKEYKYKSTAKKYCSYECSNSAKWESRKKGDVAKIICKTCGKEFEMLVSVKNAREKNGTEIKYCSQKCSGIGSKKAKFVECANCGVKFETTRNKCCSKECTVEYRKKSGVHKRNGWWLENGYKVLYLEGDKSIKEHIKIMQDHIGRNLTPNEIVHHIDEDKLNNSIENLKLMTRGEHSKLHRNIESSKGKVFFKPNITIIK